MYLKNSILLLTALTAGSAVARTHGHERRHAAAHKAHEEKRDLGDMVTVTMDGKVVSWANDWAGAAAATTTTTDDSVSAPTAVVEAAAATSATTTDNIPSATPVSSASGTCSSWDDTPGDYSREGFGEKTIANLLEYIFYKGNVGTPWGSNIIQVTEEKACQYKHVVRFEGVQSDAWTVVFWNKIGPDDKLTGWYGYSALKITLNPGEVKYVAFDDDTQGAWGAAKGDSLPTDEYGGYSCTWGEIDFSNVGNDDWSGWDVSAIQAQSANQDVQGMKICDSNNSGCSYITNLATKMDNAYSALEKGVDGIGGRQAPGPVRLITHLDYSG
ncbi:hypothetical protein BDW59DRAFT_95916 [Aspergillus cavernicola]|uniref:Allergen Asp f 4 n=1 Tax=Aspergillus cavernicola TaxID=176166 RepID=A0ABR4I7G2_9EURO